MVGISQTTGVQVPAVAAVGCEGHKDRGRDESKVCKIQADGLLGRSIGIHNTDLQSASFIN